MSESLIAVLHFFPYSANATINVDAHINTTIPAQA